MKIICDMIYFFETMKIKEKKGISLIFLEIYIKELYVYTNNGTVHMSDL